MTDSQTIRETSHFCMNAERERERNKKKEKKSKYITVIKQNNLIYQLDSASKPFYQILFR